MGRTRRSGHTAGEALPLQLHIAGLTTVGVGSFSRRRALAACAGRSRRPSMSAATRSAVLCLRAGGVTWATRRRRGRRNPRSRNRRRDPRVVPYLTHSSCRCSVPRAIRDEIGAMLSIATKTVEGHLRRLFERLGVASRAELAARAVTEGWLDVPTVQRRRPRRA
jgi:hypothetical protein